MENRDTSLAPAINHAGAGGDAKQRVLDAAETLFMQRSYAAITLRDIADALEMRQASLYYHFPEGKQQLYVAVAERVFARHRRGLTQAVAGTKPDVAAQLHAAAEWFVRQPRMNLSSIMHADMPALDPQTAARLSQMAYDAFFAPLRSIFVDGQTRGEIRPVHPDVMTGSFIAILDGVHFSDGRTDAPSRDEMLDDVISVLLDGLRPRSAAE